jgi:hypothetical protein
VNIYYRSNMIYICILYRSNIMCVCVCVCVCVCGCIHTYYNKCVCVCVCVCIARRTLFPRFTGEGASTIVPFSSSFIVAISSRSISITPWGAFISLFFSTFHTYMYIIITHTFLHIHYIFTHIYKQVTVKRDFSELVPSSARTHQRGLRAPGTPLECAYQAPAAALSCRLRPCP